MVGKLGTLEVAAVGLALTLFAFTTVPLEVFFDNALILLSNYYGQDDEYNFKKVFYHELLLGSLFSLSGIIFYPIFRYVLILMSPTDRVLQFAREYLFISLISLIPYVFNWILTKGLISMNKNKFLANISNIVVCINIILNYIFIFGKFGCPKLGVIGSSIATLIARCIQSVLLYYSVNRVFENDFTMSYKFEKDNKLLKDILKLGYPMAHANFIEIFAWTIFIGFISKLGVAALAAHEIGMRIKDIAFMPGIALSNVVTSLIGGAVGQNDYVSVKEHYSNVNVVAIIVMGIVGIIIFIFPTQLLMLFSTDLETINIGKKLLSILIIYQIIDAMFIVARGSLNAIDATRFVRNIIILGGWIIMLPLSYIFINFLNLGVLGAWLGLTFNVLISGTIMRFQFRRVTNKKYKNN